MGAGNIMRRLGTTRGLSLAYLAKQPFDNDGADALYQPPPLDAPPVAPSGWSPAPLVKSVSYSFWTLLVQSHNAGPVVHRLLALIISQVFCALRTYRLASKCRPVVDDIKTATKERTATDGLARLPSTKSVDRPAACPLSPTARCCSYARASPPGCTKMQDAAIPPLILAAAA